MDRRTIIAALAAAKLALGPAALAQGQAPAPQPPAPGAPPAESLPPPSASTSVLALSATFAGTSQIIASGLVWRVLREEGENVQPVIVERSSAAQPVFRLGGGSYIVHVAYGFASSSKRVVIPEGRQITDRLPISAGGLKLGGAIANGPIPPDQVRFSVYVPLAGNAEGRLVAENVRPGDILRLPEGSYHVVSTYGDANAIRTADIKVDSSLLVEATIHHRAARATLKLVANPGGEAFAGTAFTVLTPGGDVIREAMGAFPEVILAEGEYVLIARQEGQVFTREFRVETGFDRDVEVIAARPEPNQAPPVEEP